MQEGRRGLVWCLLEENMPREGFEEIEKILLNRRLTDWFCQPINGTAQFSILKEGETLKSFTERNKKYVVEVLRKNILLREDHDLSVEVCFDRKTNYCFDGTSFGSYCQGAFLTMDKDIFIEACSVEGTLIGTNLLDRIYHSKVRARGEGLRKEIDKVGQKIDMLKGMFKNVRKFDDVKRLVFRFASTEISKPVIGLYKSEQLGEKSADAAKVCISDLAMLKRPGLVYSVYRKVEQKLKLQE